MPSFFLNIYCSFFFGDGRILGPIRANPRLRLYSIETSQYIFIKITQESLSLKIYEIFFYKFRK